MTSHRIESNPKDEPPTAKAQCSSKEDQVNGKQTPAFTEQDLEELWHEKFDYRVNKLHVSREKAKEWTDRTIRVIREEMLASGDG